MKNRYGRGVARDGADNVTARVTIWQNPLAARRLAVPAGSVGHIEDEADGYLFVDFGEPYGTVQCEPADLRG